MAYRMSDPEIEQCDFIHVHEDIVNRVTKVMPDEDQLMDLAEFFKIFGGIIRTSRIIPDCVYRITPPASLLTYFFQQWLLRNSST